MRVSTQIFLLFLAVILIGCVLGPPVHIALQKILGGVFGLEYFLNVPFERVLSRVYLVGAFLFLFLFRRSLSIADSIRQSLIRPRRWLFLLRTGFGLGVVSLFLLILFLAFCGAVQFHPFEIPPGRVAYRFASALATGLAVGFIEEIFFRGFVLQTLQREMKTVWALLVTSVFYAVLHYFKAPSHVALNHLDWMAGFSTAVHFLAPFRNVAVMIGGVIGLTIVGIVLGIAYLRTGSLYLSIGLHAGWVFLIKSKGTFSSRVSEASVAWFGDDKIVTGIAAWGMLAAVGLFLWLWAKRLALPPEGGNKS